MNSTAAGPGGVDGSVVVLGVDLGDAETSISRALLGPGAPVALRLDAEATTVPTVIADGLDNQTVIARAALEVPGFSQLGVSAKKRPTGGIDEHYDSRQLTQVVQFLRILFDRVVLPDLATPESDLSIWIGCPSSWTERDREIYRKKLAAEDFVDVHLVSESRAIALVVAEKNDYAEAFAPILVIDLGSSTTDITVISSLVPNEFPFGGDFGVNRLDKQLATAAIDFGGPDLAAMTATDSQLKYLIMLCRLWRERSTGRAVDYPFADRRGTQRQGRQSPAPFGQQMCDLVLPVLESTEFHRRARAEMAGWLHEFELLVQEVHRTTGDVGRVVLCGGGALLPPVAEVVHGVYGDSVDPPGDDLTVVADGLARLGRWEMRKDALARLVGQVLDAGEFGATVGAIVDRHFTPAFIGRLMPPLAGAMMRAFAGLFETGITRASVDEKEILERADGEVRAVLNSPVFADVVANELALARAEIEKHCDRELGVAFAELGVEWSAIELDLDWVEIIAEALPIGGAVSELRGEMAADLAKLSKTGRWLAERYLTVVGKPVASGFAQVTPALARGSLWVVKTFRPDLIESAKEGGLFGGEDGLRVGRKVASYVRPYVESRAGEQMARVAPFLAR